MQAYTISANTEYSNLPGEHQVLAIGDFDGIHTGHREVLQRALNTGEQLHLPAAVMTFEPHPRVVLGLSQYEESITPLEEKLKAFEALGMSHAYVVKFDREFAALPPEEFVERILIGLQVQTVVIGFDFTFGYQGKGNADTLVALAKGRFAVEVVRPIHMGGEKVSSTLIRECLLNGQVEKAARLLGRPFSFRGKVVTGEGRGRTIGIPTANLDPADAYVIPGRGVYAVEAVVRGQRYGGVMNIGWKPTFAEEGGQTTLEAHLFDFSEMIYGETVTVRFIGFIRHERKFVSAAELVEQIRSDMLRGKEMLDEHLH
ncbi:bifunctional riboflavin kinase/FAD synthetase [Gorillibacterium sp. sgz5001074]|uniref:bifunctional riboflavin kinase/FAD synthetase n=1 Tax=Gorillibacterium sp. sgz5001074 TaxID=3446695 RepID=UPI003F676DDB